MLEVAENVFIKDPDCQKVCMPLCFLRSGQCGVVCDFCGGKEIRKRLHDLGLHNGSQVEIMQNENSGPLIIKIKNDSRLALGRGMAQKVMVVQESA